MSTTGLYGASPEFVTAELAYRRERLAADFGRPRRKRTSLRRRLHRVAASRHDGRRAD